MVSTSPSEVVVPKEAIEAAAAAFVDHYDHLPEDIKEHWRHRARRVLPAAAPLILAAELDAQASELEAHADSFSCPPEGTPESGMVLALGNVARNLRARAAVLRGEQTGG